MEVQIGKAACWPVLLPVGLEGQVGAVLGDVTVTGVPDKDFPAPSVITRKMGSVVVPASSAPSGGVSVR